MLSIIETNIYENAVVQRGLEIMKCLCRYGDDVRKENAENVSLLGKLGACHVVINCLKVDLSLSHVYFLSQSIQTSKN